MTERDAREIYSDIIAPKLATLDQRVKVAKRGLVKKALRSAGAATGVISFGLSTGFVSPEMMAVISALGLGKIGYDVIASAIPIGESTDSIKNEDFYFLWKARNLTN